MTLRELLAKIDKLEKRIETLEQTRTMVQQTVASTHKKLNGLKKIKQDLTRLDKVERLLGELISKTDRLIAK